MIAFEPSVEIVSPDYPCGHAWLANALIELSVPLWSLWGRDTRSEWLERTDGSFTYAAPQLPWRQVLASLHLGRTFRFRDDIAPRFSHLWPWQVDLSKPIILIVRDPRDALHSEWRRHQHNLGLDRTIEFPDFIGRPFTTAPLSANDMLWLYLHVWTEAMRERAGSTMLLRFEDWKEDAVRELERVNRFLELECSRDRLGVAAKASEVDILKRLEQAVAETDPYARQFNRRGHPYEWKEVWQPEWNNVFDRRWEPVYASLGYEVPDRFMTSPAAIDVEKVLLSWAPIDAAGGQRWKAILSRSLRTSEPLC